MFARIEEVNGEIVLGIFIDLRQAFDIFELKTQMSKVSADIFRTNYH